MSATEENPLLSQWDGSFAAPPFSKLRAEHFRPAFEAALTERRAEIAAIKANPAAADFSNTILALERAGQKLDRVSRAFFHLSHADFQPSAGRNRARDCAGPRPRAQRDIARRRAFRPRRPGFCASLIAWMRKRAGSSNAIASPSCARAPGSTPSARTRRLALAVPAPEAASLLASLAPEVATALARISVANIESVGVVAEARNLRLPRLAGIVPVDDTFFSVVTSDVVPDDHLRAFTFHFRAGMPLDRRIDRICAVAGLDRGQLVCVATHTTSLPSLSLGRGAIACLCDSTSSGNRRRICRWVCLPRPRPSRWIRLSFTITP